MTKRTAKLSRRQRAYAALGATVVAVAAVLAWVDLSPRVEPDFFFAADDPQLRASTEIAHRFPSPPQIIIRVDGAATDAERYRDGIRGLTGALRAVPGIQAVNSITTDDAEGSPLWRRLLRTPDGTASNIIVQTDGSDPALLVPRLEAVLATFDQAAFGIEVSGVPYVIEQIRRSLRRDLAIFSSAAFVMFGLLIGVVYRRWQIVLGTLSSCLVACCATLIVSRVAGIAIGLLTANIAVIVFVLTLSHIVFITANWRRECERPRPLTDDPVAAGVRVTLWASFWCMVTTLLGFASLLTASAKPLRELGMAGVVGTVTALGVAYTVYPVYLRAIPRLGLASASWKHWRIGQHFPRTHPVRWLAAIAVVVALAAVGVPRISTDPSLLSYFARGSKIRGGLEAIDRDGGSSPLNLVVADASGGRLDTDAANEKMWEFQNALEADTAVGVTLSPAILLAHAQRAPLAGFLSWRRLLDILESPLFNRIALSFVSPDREQGLFFLRMRESGRAESREAVIERARTHASRSGLEVVLVGGQYDLQGKLGRLIASSLRIGLGGLLSLFVLVAWIVSRSPRVTVAMVLCLVAIPLLVLGTIGHAGAAIDIVTSPAANVALAMGVDSMIHLVVRARRLRREGADGWNCWLTAREQLWQPIAGASLIICAGFGIFSLSTFPPTQRFGIAVILGTVTAAVMALVALPFAAAANLGSARARALQR